MARAKTILLYSDSGNSKTSQCVHIAKYIKAKYGKITRLISSDGGGWAPVEDEGLIISKDNPAIDMVLEKGVWVNKGGNGCVEAFNMTNRKRYLADWRKLSVGMWPHVVEQDGRKVRIISQCTPQETQRVGCYFIEGLTSIGSGFISHISKQDNTSDVTKVLFKAASYEEDGEFFGSTDKGHVGMTQNELHNLTQAFGALQVEMVVWTALVGQANEAITKKPIYGPKLSGNAKTPEAPSWFSDCFHLHAINEKEMIDNITVENKRILAFYQRHEDEETGNVYLCKSSVGPSLYLRLKKRYPGGFVELGFDNGIVDYLETVDGLREGTK
jgi:hypothetical protein